MGSSDVRALGRCSWVTWDKGLAGHHELMELKPGHLADCHGDAPRWTTKRLRQFIPKGLGQVLLKEVLVPK